MQIRNIVVGVLLAITIVVGATTPTLWGISTWKYLLALIGLTLVIRAGRAPKV